VSSPKLPKTWLGLQCSLASARVGRFFCRTVLSALHYLRLFLSLLRLVRTNPDIAKVVVVFYLSSKARQREVLSRLKANTAFETNERLLKTKHSLIELLESL